MICDIKRPVNQKIIVVWSPVLTSSLDDLVMHSFAALSYNLEAGCFYREYVTYEERKLSCTFQSLPLSSLPPRILSTPIQFSKVKSFWHQFSAFNHIKSLSFIFLFHWYHLRLIRNFYILISFLVAWFWQHVLFPAEFVFETSLD